MKHMKRWNEGEKGEIPCQVCGRLMPTTLRFRDVGFDDNPVVVRDLLVDVCDLCDEIVAIPANATPQIRAALFGAHEAARVELADALALPSAQVVIDLPTHPTSRSFIDTEIAGETVTATYCPSEGYGLFSAPAVYGETPDRFERDATNAAAFIRSLTAR